jgi:hypothetical protein
MKVQVVQAVGDQAAVVGLHQAAHLVHVPVIVHHVPVIVHHVPVIVHHVPVIVHHVPVIVHHVPVIAQSSAQVVAVAMIAPVLLAMFQMVALSAILADSVLHRWSVILRAYVHESLNLIFRNMSPVKNLKRAFAPSS